MTKPQQMSFRNESSSRGIFRLSVRLRKIISTAFWTPVPKWTMPMFFFTKSERCIVPTLVVSRFRSTYLVVSYNYGSQGKVLVELIYVWLSPRVCSQLTKPVELLLIARQVEKEKNLTSLKTTIFSRLYDAFPFPKKHLSSEEARCSKNCICGVKISGIGIFLRVRR